MKKLFLVPLSIFAILMFACGGETEEVEVTKEVVVSLYQKYISDIPSMDDLKDYFIKFMLYLEFLDGQGLGNQLWNYGAKHDRFCFWLSKGRFLSYNLLNNSLFSR